MKPIFTLVFGLLYLSVGGQNLVTNGSFEINSGCPSQIGQVALADGWVNWGITPDYFHSCSNLSNPSYGTPTNVRGFQVPRTGVAYMGLFTYNDQTANSREFIGRELAQPLVPGILYHVSLWVSRAGQLLCSHASDKVGVRFTTVSNYSLVNPDTALNNGHVFATTLITDSIGWFRISGTFLADSAYTHIGIGNYFDDVNTAVDTSNAASNYAYYLIDDVCVSADPFYCDSETGMGGVPATMRVWVVPNPAHDQLWIRFQEVAGVNSLLKITAPDGRLFKLTAVDPGAREHRLDVSDLPRGVYLILFESESARAVSKIVLY